MPFDNFVDEGSDVKSSPTEESDNSMKVVDARASKHWGRVSSTSSSYFIVLTTKLAVPAIRMVSWELWAKLSPTMQ
jgi:hypothetical protein